MDVGQHSESDATLPLDGVATDRCRPVRVIAVLILLVVAVTAALRLKRSSAPLADIQIESRRNIAARVADFRYAPYRPLADAKSNSRVLRAAEDIAGRFTAERNATTYHHLGVVQLAMGEFQQAAESLASAAVEDPQNARILSDLAAAQIAAGQIEDGAETAGRALESEPSLRSAAFNWALSLEEIGNQSEAAKAWRRYLEIEPEEEWAAEARNHLRALTKPRPRWETERQGLVAGAPRDTVDHLVTRYPQRSRYWVQEELLPRFAATESAADLELARRIAQTRAAGGDPFLLDVVEHAAPRAATMKAGLQAFAAARLATHDRHMDDAVAQYDRAIAELRRTGSPLVIAATVFAASNDFYRNDYARALARLDDAERAVHLAGDRYTGVSAEADWVRSLILARSGDGGEIEVLERARGTAVRGQEWETVLALDTLLVSAADRNGRAQDAERFRLEVLRRMAEYGASAERTATFFARCALSNSSLGRPRVALAFLDATLEIPLVQRDALFLADVQAARALALHDTGKKADAALALETSRHAAQRIETPALRERAISDIDFAAGVMELRADSPRSVFFLTSALQAWQQHGWRLRTAKAFLVRGNAYRAARDDRAAEADYRAGIEQMEHQRGTFAEPELRVAYFEDSADLFEQLIDLLVSERRYDDAFGVAERKRARWLLEHRFGDGTGQPLGAREIAPRLPSGTALLQYVLLPEGASMWLVLPTRTVYARSSASRRAIDDATERWRSAILRGDAGAVQKESRWLFGQLIEPVRREIPADLTIAIVPDGELSSLPFAALRDAGGKYLVELHALLYAPSATTFVSSGQAIRQPRSVLAVACPGGGRLPRLGAVEEEAAAIAEMYSRPTLLKGIDATPQRFLAQSEVVDVVHFAGHAQGDALLFGSYASDRVLSARTIAASNLRSRPLIVLAACSTARGRQYRTEGVGSLAVAFLHSGARGVVATLWNTEDGAASRLALALHRQLRNGVAAAEALCRVQRSMISSSVPAERDPASWAGMIVVGRG